MDARLLLDETRRDLEDRFAALRAGGAAGGGLPDLLRRLSERWTLEEHWLYPALHEAWHGERSAFEAHEQELAPLRGLVERVRQDPSPAEFAVLEGVVTLHLDSVAALLHRADADGRRVDWRRLGRDMAAMQARWADEVAATGDIEDEEADPVGRPPR